jgi:hypothetical protein
MKTYGKPIFVRIDPMHSDDCILTFVDENGVELESTIGHLRTPTSIGNAVNWHLCGSARRG